MQLAILGEAFNGGNFGTIGLNGQGGARFDGHAIHVNGTGTALAGVAADVGTGKAEVITQEMNEEGAGFNLSFH
jgi:hypothetical protein